MANPVTKWTGFPNLTEIPHLVQEQLWRNVIRPWYVDSGCSMHMTGDISNLHVIQTINDGYVSFAGKEKGNITQMGTVRNDMLKKGNFVSEMIRFKEV